MNMNLLRAFRGDLRRIERNVERTLKSQTSCCGVSSAQCHALLEMAALGPVNLAALSEMLVLDPSTVSRTVEAMTAAGLVERRQDAGNRRRVVLTLTAAGREKAASVNGACDRIYAAAARKFAAAGLPALARSARMLADLMDMASGCCEKEEK